MAYVSQEMKKELAPTIKKVLKNYGMRGSIAVFNHNTLVCNIKSGTLDVLGCLDRNNVYNRDHLSVNPYWIKEDFNDSSVVQFLTELKIAMEGDNFYCNDDSITDYYHRSHYIEINVGRWSAPYILEA